MSKQESAPSALGVTEGSDFEAGKKEGLRLASFYRSKATPPIYPPVAANPHRQNRRAYFEWNRGFNSANYPGAF